MRLARPRRRRRAGGARHERARGLLRKELYHILRDRRTLAVLLLLPVVQVVLFGFAIRTDVDDVRLAIVDPAPDARDAGAAQPVRGHGRLPDRRGRAATSTRSSALFQRGSAQAGDRLRAGFADHLAPRPAGASC